MMTISWRQSLIYGGVGATLSLWVLNTLSHSLGDWLPAIVLGSGIAWVALKVQKAEPVRIKSEPITINRIQTALADAQNVVDQLAFEAQDLSIDGSAQQLSDLRSQINLISTELHRDEIRFVVMGGKWVGKTTLTNLLAATWAAELSQNLTLHDTPELFAATEGGLIAERDAWKMARSADVVLFVTNGDLTATEFSAIEQITSLGKRLILILNKQDQYLPEQQQLLLNHLRHRLKGKLDERDILAIATNPKSLKIRQHQSDGTIREWLEKPEPQILPLIDRLNQILLTEGQQLVLTSSMSNVKAIKAEAKTALNRVRREQAMPRIDQAQWIVAGTAFASPFPALDLLATAAINAQMVMDLGNLYQRKFSLEQARTIAANMAGVMLKLGLVEVSTSAIAQILKTNAVTFIAGGLMQGVSAAYLTRLAGLTLIEYFEGETVEIKPDLVQQIMQKVFEQNRRLPFLQAFVKSAIDKLVPATITPKSTPQIVPDAPEGLPAPQEVPIQLEAKLEHDQPLQPLQIGEKQVLEEEVIVLER